MPRFFPYHSAGSKTAGSFFQLTIGACGAVMGTLALSDFHPSLVFFFLAMVVSIYIAVRFPIVHLIIYIWIAIVATLFHNWGEGAAGLLVLPGVGVNEIFLAGMFAAIAIRAWKKLISPLSNARRFSPKQKPWLELFIFGFGLWLAVSVGRNFGMYGLSTFGELRSQYLILILPIYIALVLDTRQRRLTFFKLFFFHCFFVPLLLLPIIGTLKGWGIGPRSRFYTSNNSLGILMGIIIYLIGSRYKVFKTNIAPFWALLPLALCLILVDSHRSVWFSGIVMWAAYVYIVPGRLGHWRLSNFAMFFFVIIGFFLASMATSYILDVDLLDYIIQRGDDVFDLEVGHGNTWAWRVANWERQLDRIADVPFTGLGLGGYWGLTERAGDYGISPHNLYVQILVKLGIIGLALFLLTMALVFRKLQTGIFLTKSSMYPEVALLHCGFIALIGSHVYYFAYAFNLHCLILIGLAMATFYYNLYPGKAHVQD